MNQCRQNKKDVPGCSSIGKFVSVLHRRAQAFYTRYLKEYNISLAEYPVLFMLSAHDGVTQDEIAWDQGMDKAAVARVIKSLESKEMVTRRKDSSDRRCNYVFLTEKGRSTHEPISKAKAYWNSVITEGMTKEESDSLVKLLEVALDNVYEHENGEYYE